MLFELTDTITRMLYGTNRAKGGRENFSINCEQITHKICYNFSSGNTIECTYRDHS